MDYKSVFLQERLDHLFTILLCVFALTLPLSITLNSIVIITLVALSMFKQYCLYKSIESDYSWKLKMSDLLYFSYFILLLVGLTYSDNPQSGLNTIEKSLSFIAVPLVFANRNISKHQLRLFFVSFTVACLVIVISNIVRSAFFGSHGFIQGLTYEKFDPLFKSNTTYLSIYLSVISFYWLLTREKYSSTNRIVLFLFLLFVFFILVVLGSRVVILFHVLFTLGLLVKQKSRFIFSLLLTLTLVLASQLKYNHVIKERVLTALQFDDSLEQFNYGGGKLRSLMWLSLLKDGISKNWVLGFGTGGGIEYRNEIYHNNELQIPLRENYNSHNQYINNLYHNGIVAVLLIVLILYQSLKTAIKRKDIHFIFFIILIAGGFLTEVILSRQKGVVFFTFLNFIYLNLEHSSSAKRIVQ